MKFHILGSDYLGNMIAHYLQKYNHQVTLLFRTPVALTNFENRKRKITLMRDNENDIEQSYNYDIEILRGYNKNELFNQYKIYSSKLPPIQRLIVTTKAHEISNSFQKIFYRLSPTSTVIIISRSMGIYEELMEKFFSNNEYLRPNILLGSSTHLCYGMKNVNSPFDIFHSGVGGIDIGVIPRRVENIENVESVESVESVENKENIKNLRISTFSISTEHELSTSILEKETNRREGSSLGATIKALTQIKELQIRCINVLSLQNRLLENLVINSCINPLTTIFNMRNRGLLFNPGADRVLQALCNESAKVMREHRKYLGMRPSNRFGPGRLVDAIQQICQETSSRKSDMLKDAKRRYITEIDYLNGYLVKLGKIYDIPTPLHQLVVDMVYLKHRLLSGPRNNLKERYLQDKFD
ncbi:2-dehydropantoate 2-reductase [Gigaspora margarita]|uniref:2-dehydropantoate 2-reductase n=1 Tax=Gigaspora margarita TaxID=4874 RepID=A0A8H4EPT4_GIGMA|nr:2-dehydropantoate 2-reductase [Gigaspora margarita]